MEDKDDPPNAMISRYPRPKQPKKLTRKQQAMMMYKDLCNDEQLMRELNILLRQRKLEQIKNKNGRTIS